MIVFVIIIFYFLVPIIFIQKLKNTLIKHRTRDYAIVSDSQEKYKIIILNKNKAENLGIYHCHHCGMSFDNEIQLTMHHRIHYLIKIVR